VAGVVLAEFGPGTAFLANAISFLLVLVALTAVHPRPIEMPEDHPPILEHFRAGVHYMRERSALALPALTILVVSFFGSSMVQLSKPFSRVVFDVGNAKYGLLVGAFGTGALIGVLISMFIGDRVRRSRMAMTGLAVLAVGEIVLGSAPTYAVGIVGLFAMGVAYTLVAVALNTSIQARVDESHRGRVLSIYLMGLLAGVPLGALVGGALAEGIGLRVTIIAGGSLLIGFAALAVAKFDAMQALDETVEPVHTDPLLTNQPAIAGAD
jgi:MFS family permease